MCCDHTQRPSISMCSTPVSHIPYLRRETCADSSTCCPSWPFPPFYLRRNATGKRNRRGCGGERSTETTHFKCERTRWMAVAAEWRQHVFTSQGISKSFFLPSMYNEFVLLLLFRLSLRLRKTFSMGALIVSVLCWSCEFSVAGLATGLAAWHLSRDYLC